MFRASFKFTVVAEKEENVSETRPWSGERVRE